VTLWLLYSVFRSRDIRNNRNRRAGEGSSTAGKHFATPVNVEAELKPIMILQAMVARVQATRRYSTLHETSSCADEETGGLWTLLYV
jgi:hypothetical protein